MALFCSTREFESLCREIAGKADILCLQAKGGSMYPFIRSGDWVDVSFCKGKGGNIHKGDILLFKKDDSLYLHRFLRRAGEGLLVKGDMSFGHDGLISEDDVFGRVVSIKRNGRRIDLRSGCNRAVNVIAADISLVLQYPLLFARKACVLGMTLLGRLQAFKVYRMIAKQSFNGTLKVRAAGPQDQEQLRDLYRMSGHDIREGIAEIKKKGYWLIAERNRKLAGALTMTRYENDPALWVIFGLEVKPLFRGAGAGRTIVKAAILKAKESGAGRIGLAVNKKNKPALGLYYSLGFKAASAPAGFNCSLDELYLSYEVEDSSDWRLVLEKAVEEGVFYPLYRNLLCSEEKNTALARDIRERYRQAYYLYLSKSSEYIFRVERVLGFLESRKITALIFKGPAIDHFIYDNFFRPRLDLDIIVRDEDLNAFEAALRELGYRCLENEKDYSLPEYLNSRFFIPQSDDLIPLHVHKHLINNMFLTVDNALSLDMRTIWRETGLFKEYGYIYMLKPELNIIYLCEHGVKHNFDQMVFLYEIERLLGFYEEKFNWKKLVSLSERCGLGRSTYYGLYFIKEALSARIPQEVMDALRPVRFAVGEKSFVKNTLSLKRSRYASYPVYCAMRPGLLKKICFIFLTFFPPGFTLKGYATRILRLILP
ncbi:MAG: GNAT family N-acetyltransferase [Candidatus Omnitrophota bacterium]